MVCKECDSEIHGNGTWYGISIKPYFMRFKEEKLNYENLTQILFLRLHRDYPCGIS